MTRRFLSGVPAVILAGFADREMDASDPNATIDQAIRIIQTKPSLEISLRPARLRQDSRQFFPIHLAIQVRK